MWNEGGLYMAALHPVLPPESRLTLANRDAIEKLPKSSPFLYFLRASDTQTNCRNISSGIINITI
jgi:hypothetical protein